MKNLTLLTLLVLFVSATGTTLAVDNVDIQVTASWVSQYVWRGIDKLDDKAAFQPSVNLDFGNGFSFNVWASLAGGSKNGGRISTVDAEEHRYSLTYANSIDDFATKVNYATSWVYYDYPDQASKSADAQEINLSISLPEICPGGFVPSYTIVKMWSAKSGGPSNGLSGWIHVIGLDYDIPTEEIPLHFSWDLTYNGSAGAPGLAKRASVDHDWSHMTWGLSSPMACGNGTLTPAIYYQTSMEDTVNPTDEFWTGITYSFAF